MPNQQSSQVTAPNTSLWLGRVLIKPANVRFSPKATELLRGSEMARWATSRHRANGFEMTIVAAN